MLTAEPQRECMLGFARFHCFLFYTEDNRTKFEYFNSKSALQEKHLYLCASVVKKTFLGTAILAFLRR